MSEARYCPHCGSDLTPEVVAAQRSVAESSSDDRISPISLLAPGSSDETFLTNNQRVETASTEPDPILGAYQARPAFDSPIESNTIKPSRIRSSAQFPTINLESQAKASSTPTGPPSSAGMAITEDEAEAEEDEEPDESPGGLSRVLLASYASAVTLGLIWFVIKDRSRDKSELVPSETAGQRTPPARQQERSKTVLPPEPIIGEHFAKLGQSLKVGSLEITPLEVKRQDVKLQRANVLSANEFRDGGKRALVLRLKLRNLSDDTVFAPLDQTYVRQHDDEPVDTFVTTADHERVYPFSLAVESEWSIVGQDFQELRPRESRIVSIVTAPDAPPNEAGPFTWRVRLRTGINRTDLVGVVWPSTSDGASKAKSEKNP